MCVCVSVCVLALCVDQRAVTDGSTGSNINRDKDTERDRQAVTRTDRQTDRQTDRRYDQRHAPLDGHARAQVSDRTKSPPLSDAPIAVVMATI